MKKITIYFIVLLLVFNLVGCGGAEEPAEEPVVEEPVALKAALLTSGPINDGGWNTAAYNGLLLLEDKHGFEISYTENIKQDDHVTMLRNYAKKDFDLIIGHGYEYGDALQEVAEEYPDIYFLNTGGMIGGTKPNLSSGVFENGVLGFLAGRLAAEVTETNKIGFVGAMEIPTVIGEVEALTAASKYFNPEVNVTVAYTGSWVDIAAGKEAALAQIANGCDFLIAIGDACNAGVIQAAEENDVWAFGWSGDMNVLAPDHVITSGVQSVSAVIELYAMQITNNSWKSEAGVFGIAEGTQFLGVWADGTPEEAKSNILADYAKFESGEYTRDIALEMIGLSH